MAGIAVSAQQQGLLTISQQATLIGLSLSYHDYEGLALNPDEKPRLQAHLGDTRHMILRNHGLLTVGRTISDAFLAMYSLQRACEIQLLAQAGGNAQLINIPQTVLDTVPEFLRLVTRGAGSGIVWPALLRKMDRLDPGYRE
jgi:ribulose-5-phosphate 4-epimerase/fuculose-1-phosphate aldolase